MHLIQTNAILMICLTSPLNQQLPAELPAPLGVGRVPHLRPAVSKHVACGLSFSQSN